VEQVVVRAAVGAFGDAVADFAAFWDAVADFAATARVPCRHRTQLSSAALAETHTTAVPCPAHATVINVTVL
jgi:hypothetical protein